jgi:hypothetical protein
MITGKDVVAHAGLIVKSKIRADQPRLTFHPRLRIYAGAIEAVDSTQVIHTTTVSRGQRCYSPIEVALVAMFRLEIGKEFKDQSSLWGQPDVAYFLLTGSAFLGTLILVASPMETAQRARPFGLPLISGGLSLLALTVAFQSLRAAPNGQDLFQLYLDALVALPLAALGFTLALVVRGKASSLRTNGLVGLGSLALIAVTLPWASDFYQGWKIHSSTTGFVRACKGRTFRFQDGTIRVERVNHRGPGGMSNNSISFLVHHEGNDQLVEVKELQAVIANGFRIAVPGYITSSGAEIELTRADSLQESHTLTLRSENEPTPTPKTEVFPGMEGRTHVLGDASVHVEHVNYHGPCGTPGNSLSLLIHRGASDQTVDLAEEQSIVANGLEIKSISCMTAVGGAIQMTLVDPARGVPMSTPKPITQTIEPADEASCLNQGGSWRPVGMRGNRPNYRCALRTHDAGKRCSDGSDCEGHVCVAPRGAKPGDHVGTCIEDSLNGLGSCLPHIVKGVVQPPLCLD